MNLKQLNTFKKIVLDGSLEICKGDVTPTQIYELANKALEEALTIPLVVSTLCWNDECNNERMKGHIACKECHEKVLGKT